MKTALWKSLIPKLVERFRAVGIERCELRFKGCTGAAFTGFAHAYKRRNVPKGAEDVVILACTNCHSHIEHRMPEAEMTRIVLATITKRTRQPAAKRPCFIPAPTQTQTNP